MIAEVGVGGDLRAAAAGRTIVTGEIALLTTTITAPVFLLPPGTPGRADFTKTGRQRRHTFFGSWPNVLLGAL